MQLKKKHTHTQLKRHFRPSATKNLSRILDKWKTRTDEDKWIQGQQSQTPKQLWAHRNILTEYQVWVTYRLATLQLNMYYIGKEDDQGCPLNAQCTDTTL
ncbi:hypothetical protein F443_02748 [Phytophthora nicotianae P1569]|uniref:Uncharacterized protein n=1 Tax=Phytophthora nicotianae P1569 TaxID=1317065 RepID=V9FUK2_PHYNI|nr:hypothetical protein F443_02748 [Phytophthora nicotianae P1569]